MFRQYTHNIYIRHHVCDTMQDLRYRIYSADKHDMYICTRCMRNESRGSVWRGRRNGSGTGLLQHLTVFFEAFYKHL